MQIGQVMYYVTKEFPQSLGLSCVYRNHRAQSHCRFLHGYALSFSVTMRAMKMDEQGWVYDFGDFKFVKEYLVQRYDHTLLVAEDDPEVPFITTIGVYELAQVVKVRECSTEAYAKDLFNFVCDEIKHRCRHNINGPRVFVHKVTGSERDGNSAAYRER